MKITVCPSGFLNVNSLFVPLEIPGENSGGIPVIVFDPGGDSCVAELSRRTMIPKAVVLTHGHFDHVMGLGALKKAFPAIPIAVHPAETRQFGTGITADSRAFMLSLGMDEDMVRELQALPDADILLGEGSTLGALFANEDSPEMSALKQAASAWRALSTPGHTPGSLCFYNEKERALISGDTMFEGTWGRTDFPGGSETEIYQSLRRLFKELPGGTTVYPGHEGWGFTLAENFLPV